MILLRGGTLVTFDPPRAQAADLLLEHGIITRRGRNLSPPANARVLDARDRVIIPGLVDLRHRLGLSLLPGLGPPGVDSDRGEHELALAHTEETVICAAFVGSLRALGAGVTCIVDLQDSPGITESALGRLRDVVLTVGLRSVLAYRTSGRDGPKVLGAALRASREAAIIGGGEILRFAVGSGALSELPDKALKELAALSTGRQVAFLGEVGRVSPDDGPAGSGEPGSEVSRLREAGLLGPLTILAAGPGLSSEEAVELRQSGVTLVHCPRSDLAEGREVPPLAWFAPGGGLGSAEAPSDLFSELRLAWDLGRSRGTSLPAEAMLELLNQGHRVASRIFGQPFGALDRGAVADIAVLDYRPAFPLNDATVAHHVLFGFSAARVAAVVVNGRVLLREGLFEDLDLPGLSLQTQRGALDLWGRLHGTPFPGFQPAPLAEAAEPGPISEGLPTRWDREDLEAPEAEAEAGEEESWADQGEELEAAETDEEEEEEEEEEDLESFEEEDLDEDFEEAGFPDDDDSDLEDLAEEAGPAEDELAEEDVEQDKGDDRKRSLRRPDDEPFGAGI